MHQWSVAANDRDWLKQSRVGLISQSLDGDGSVQKAGRNSEGCLWDIL